MRLILTFLAFVLLAPTLQSQCTALTLNDLQAIQKADPTEKDAKIRGSGFDLRGTLTSAGQTIQVYSRCWSTTIKQTPVYEQKIHWNLNNDTVKFMTFNEPNFRALRTELDERHPSGIGAVVVVGKMFKYYFGAERSEGVEYHTLTLSFK
jgi:hypothetical protein